MLIQHPDRLWTWGLWVWVYEFMGRVVGLGFMKSEFIERIKV